MPTSVPVTVTRTTAARAIAPLWRRCARRSLARAVAVAEAG